MYCFITNKRSLCVQCTAIIPRPQFGHASLSPARSESYCTWGPFYFYDYFRQLQGYSRSQKSTSFQSRCSFVQYTASSLRFSLSHQAKLYLRYQIPLFALPNFELRMNEMKERKCVEVTLRIQKSSYVREQLTTFYIYFFIYLSRTYITLKSLTIQLSRLSILITSKIRMVTEFDG